MIRRQKVDIIHLLPLDSPFPSMVRSISLLPHLPSFLLTLPLPLSPCKIDIPVSPSKSEKFTLLFARYETNRPCVNPLAGRRGVFPPKRRFPPRERAPGHILIDSIHKAGGNHVRTEGGGWSIPDSLLELFSKTYLIFCVRPFSLYSS